MKKFICIFALLTLAACAGHKDVRPGADGLHRVVVTSDDPEDGNREAIRQANDYCKEKQKEAAFVHEENKYTGDMNEESYKNAKRATTVAKALGGAAFVFGGKNERTAGGLATISGGAADAALGKGYTIDMRFRCQ